MKWWAYLHTNEKIQVKRFFDHRDIDEAWESPFVKDVYGPFEAEDREDAAEQASEHFQITYDQDDE